jgi:predicted anti-sigma-YlaC factor YlaD
VAGLPFLLVASSGCSLKKMAIGSVADSLASGGSVYASDEDPELVRDAIPFTLKTLESLLQELPEHPGLLLTTCSGFTQYAYAFIQTDADLVEPLDYEKAKEMRDRARKMYLRARDYCLRRLELRHKGISAQLSLEPEKALTTTTADEVEVLYWTGAAWGSAVALGLDRPELIAELPTARALMKRALELDEDFSDGAIHAVMISLEAVPEAMGGSPTRARQHFDRAVALTHGLSAGPYVTYAASIAAPAEDRAEFERLLNAALAIDVNKKPEWRLANLIAQKRARDLLARIDDIIPPAGAAAGTGQPFIPVVVR